MSWSRCASSTPTFSCALLFSASRASILSLMITHDVNSLHYKNWQDALYR